MSSKAPAFTLHPDIAAGLDSSIPLAFLPDAERKIPAPLCGLIHFDFVHGEVLLEARREGDCHEVYADEVAVLIPVPVSATYGEIRVFLSDPDAFPAAFSAISGSGKAEDAVRKVYSRHFLGGEELTFYI